MTLCEAFTGTLPKVMEDEAIDPLIAPLFRHVGRLYDEVCAPAIGRDERPVVDALVAIRIASGDPAADAQ